MISVPGSGLIVEGTSSTVRGPGTVISSIEEYGLESKIAGYARAFPGAVVEPDGDLMLVGPDGQVKCDLKEENDTATADLLRLVEAFELDVNLALTLGGYGHTMTETINSYTVRVKVRPFLQACGLVVRYVVHDDGRRRIYVRPPEDKDLGLDDEN